MNLSGKQFSAIMIWGFMAPWSDLYIYLTSYCNFLHKGSLKPVHVFVSCFPNKFLPVKIPVYLWVLLYMFQYYFLYRGIMYIQQYAWILIGHILQHIHTHTTITQIKPWNISATPEYSLKPPFNQFLIGATHVLVSIIDLLCLFLNFIWMEAYIIVLLCMVLSLEMILRFVHGVAYSSSSFKLISSIHILAKLLSILFSMEI